MADEPQGLGWWQASDGAWYPPELHPDAPPPSAPTTPIAPIEAPPTFAAPPPVPGGPAWDAPPAPPAAAPPSKSKPTALIVAAIVVVVAIVAVVAVVLGAKDDSTTATTKSTSDATDASDSNGSSDSSDTSASTDGTSSSPDEPTGPTIEATAAGISITLPDGWTGTSTEDGVDGVGVALFPDDPDLASTFQTRVAALPRLVLLFGVDAVAARSSSDVVSNFNAAEDPTVPSGLSLDAALKAEARGVDAFADVEDQGIVSFPNVDAGRIEYSAKAGQFSGIAYVYKEAGKFWIVTFIFHDLGADNVAMADASAATFTAG
jgi:hypothetical protein